MLTYEDGQRAAARLLRIGHTVASLEDVCLRRVGKPDGQHGPGALENEYERGAYDYLQGKRAAND